MKKAAMLSIFALMLANFAFADLKELSNIAEFDQFVQEAEVPVIVKFSAYW